HSLAGFIWRYSSSINVREAPVTFPDDESTQMFGLLVKIQESLRDLPSKNQPEGSDKEDLISLSPVAQKLVDYLAKRSTLNTYIRTERKITDLDSRLGFILLFGQKVPITVGRKRYDIVVAG